MRDRNDATNVRVLSEESGSYAARSSSPKQRSGSWFVLIFGMMLAGAVFALSPPIEQLAAPEDLDVPSLTGELDLTQATSVESWTQGRIDGAPMILDVTEIDGRIVALGGEGGVAAAWTTDGGDDWKPVVLESIKTIRSVISHAVVWDGQTYAFGRQGTEPTLWRAESPDLWVQEEAIPAFRSAFLIDVIAGAEALLAVTGRPDGLVTVFSSTDAYSWKRLDGNGLEEAEQAQAFAAFDGWFYAAGADCSGGVCQPVVHRSRTGNDWDQVPLPFAEKGRLTDIAASDRGLVVAGVSDGDGQAASLLLRSSDGSDWERVDGYETAFAAPESVVELIDTDPAAASATVVIDGQTYQLGVGATIRSEAMLFTVVDVGDGRLTLEFPDTERTLRTGDQLTARGGVALQRVVAQGDRLVVSGAYLTDGAIPLATAAGVWSSTDGGERWTRSTWNASSFGATVVPFTPSARILLIRGVRGEINTWVSEWESIVTTDGALGVRG